MCTGIRHTRLEKPFLVLCATLCLLSTMSSGVELSVETSSQDVVVGPSDSIQVAIDNATTGSTIFVSAGVYSESLQINKSITLIGEGRDRTIIIGQNNQFVINITADDVSIEGFTIRSALNPSNGINIVGFKGITISYNTVQNAQQGITITSSSNDTVSNNIITANVQGIALTFSRNNLISGNTVTNNGAGFSIYFYGNNVFSGNTIVNNSPIGDDVSSSSGNVFFDNNFNDPVSTNENAPNTWDNGFEGNYWSNYAGHIRGDGIGIESYTLTTGNVDHYPLMGQFSSFDTTLANESYQVSIISNSTVSDTAFEIGPETGNRIVKFNVTGAEDTTGFSRVAVPTALMNTSVVVLIGEKEVAPTWLSSQGTALNYLYLTYSHSDQTILIISSETLNLYNQLLNQFLTSNATYYELLNSYTAQLQAGLQNLTSLYNGLLDNYTNLLGNYSQLQQSYSNLNSSYQTHLSDYSQTLQNVRNMMYILAAAAAVLIVVTAYFSKNAYPRRAKTAEEKEKF
jgi:parallel beta-helix repeat protein